jgi:peptidoglycan/xylan/chitin deacetylase (PgdA/CDA1 family)
LYQHLGDLLRPLSTSQRFDIIAELQQWSGGYIPPRQTHRALSPEEITQLAAGGLVEIGAHTVTHPVLSAIPVTQQEQEIRQSKLRLEEILNQPVESFAYPYGTRDDYTRETVNLVKQMSFTCACSNFKGVVQPQTSLYELPRFVVRDWDGEKFERNLRGWFRG